MGQRAVLWSGILLSGGLFVASAPWSYALQSCSQVPAAQRESARLAGRCEGRAPIVNVPQDARGRQAAAPRRPVPELRGRPFNNNDERLASFIVAIDYRQSVQRRDWVIDQTPRPPATLPEGGNLRVVLSDGGLVRVPDVRGNFARALVLLHRAGLTWSTGEGPLGPVVSQVPSPGATVRTGSPITLRLAPGPVALAPEATRPEVAPGTPPPAPPPSTVPAPPPAGSAPAPARTPPATTTTETRTAPATITMPDVQGMPFDAARERLAGLSVQRVHRGGTEPGGTVIGQTPPAGATVAPGAPVRLVLSDGSLVRVPRVSSFTLNEARQRLISGELRPVITNVASDAPAGTVVSQQPAEGQIAQRGSSIRLGVSSGPATPPALTVPNVVGAPYERVRPQLERFRVERTERAGREAVGTILEQSPAPGTRAEAGSTVSITVSSGGRPEVMEVVNVVGQSIDQAGNALSEFRVERELIASVEPAGRVLAQEPSAGSTAAQGSTVRVRVSDGSRVLTPSLANLTLGQAREAAQAAGVSIALSEGADDPKAPVLRQVPAPGTEVARGTAVQLAVRDRALPFALDVPPGVRDAWTRASAAALQVPARTAAIVAVVLLALLALLLLARRRDRVHYKMVEPRFESHEPSPTRRRATAPWVPSAASPESKETPATEPPRAETPAPAWLKKAASDPTPAPPSVDAAAPSPRRSLFSRRAVPPAIPPSVMAPAPAPEPEPVAFGALARLESEPALTVANGAAPRGPEIHIAARLEAGEGAVRELPTEPVPDALTEETK